MANRRVREAKRHNRQEHAVRTRALQLERQDCPCRCHVQGGKYTHPRGQACACKLANRALYGSQ